MARLQILELPTIYRDEGPDETPFILVIDQADYDSLNSLNAALEGWQSIKNQIGARAVLVFQETVEIPANETPVDPDGYPLKIRIEPDFEQFHEQVQAEVHTAQEAIRRGIRYVKEHYGALSTERPAHPDGTPYNYNEIVAGGWDHCDGCHTWGQWTAENPHTCPGTYTNGTVANTPARG